MAKKKDAIEKVPINLHFNIRVSWLMILWLLSGIILGIAVYFSTSEGGFISKFVEGAKFFFVFAGAGFLAFTSYCQWRTSLENLEFIEDRLSFDRKKNALEYLAKWDSDQMCIEREYYRKTRAQRKELSDIEILKNILADDQHRNALIDIANFFEDVSQAITAEIADEDILQKGFSPLLKSIKKTYEPWFTHIKMNDPEYYQQFAPFFNLLQRWLERSEVVGAER